MFTEEFIQNLKQTSVSVDPEKTKQRVSDLWKSASNEDKLLIEKLAGVSRASIARVYKTGSVSAKIVVPMCQTLNVSPGFLTGEADEKGESSDNELREFLLKHNYEKSLSELDKNIKKGPRKKRGATKPEQPAVGDNKADRASEEMSVEQVNEAPAPEPSTLTDINLDEEEMILLLRAAILKARQGGESEDKLSKIKTLLLA